MAYIVQAKRSPIGKFGGSLSTLPITDLTSKVIASTLPEFKELKDKVDEVILGNVISAGLGQNPSRIVAFRAGLPYTVPAFTVNKVCGSGLKSVILGAQAIDSGNADFIIAGGMENMSAAPFLLENHRFGVKYGDQLLKDSLLNDGLFCYLIGEPMGKTAEYIAKKYKVGREAQDKFAFLSHQKALTAIKTGKFKNEIVPINIDAKNGEVVFDTDEQPREDCTLEKLSTLKPAFQQNGTVTAGNSSSLNDAASIIYLASAGYLNKYNLKPMAQIKGYTSVALNPKYMGLGSYQAADKCLKKAKLKVSDIDLWEINEAFASQSLTVIDLLGIDGRIVNVNGGAIALGHPLGASGARILTTLIYELKRMGGRYGIASLCIGGGQGIAILIENL